MPGIAIRVRAYLAIVLTLLAASCADRVSSPGDAGGTSVDAWKQYTAASARHAAIDKALVDSELKAIGQSTTTRAAYTDADFKIDGTMTDAWFASSAATA